MVSPGNEELSAPMTLRAFDSVGWTFRQQLGEPRKPLGSHYECGHKRGRQFVRIVFVFVPANFKEDFVRSEKPAAPEIREQREGAMLSSARVNEISVRIELLDGS